MPVLSAFARDGAKLFRTYSNYARDMNLYNEAYQLLDVACKYRNEDKLQLTSECLRRHDEY